MSEKLEFHCPQCRKRTLVPAEKANEPVYCVKCETPMELKATTSQIAEASANAPADSSDKPAAKKTATGKTKTSKVKAEKPEKPEKPAKKTSRSKSAAADLEIPAIPTPDFGPFRCPCCGLHKDIKESEATPGTPPRCQNCFVKLDYLR